MPLTKIQSLGITDGTIVNADINASAAITTSKLSGGTNTPAFHVYLSANQSISSSTLTKVNFNAELWDTDSAYNTSTYKFIVPSGKDGKYFFSYRVKFSGIDDGEVIEGVLRKNGTTDFTSQTKSYSSASEQQVTAFGTYTMNLIGGDEIELEVYHTEGASRDLFGTTTDGSWFAGFKLIGV